MKLKCNVEICGHEETLSEEAANSLANGFDEKLNALRDTARGVGVRQVEWTCPTCGTTQLANTNMPDVFL